ncbi:MAG: hypothetical protein D6807_00280, partial [Alphaproteobacteria bacterium]
MDDYREFEDLAFEGEAGVASAPEGEGAFRFPFPILFGVSGVYETRQPLLPGRLPERVPFPLRPVPKGKAEGEEGAEDIGAEEVESELAAEEDAEFFFPFGREELRLDVDGRYPQMAASGVMMRGFGTRVTWVARLRPFGRSRWRGTIWYKEGGSLPFTAVDIRAQRSIFPQQRLVDVTFTGPGGLRRRRIYH